MGFPDEARQRLRVVVGDITTLTCDAIVNAANQSLLGGGGVDGAIHRAAGPGLLHECRWLGGCPTGEARITMGYDLPARYVIHVVGPVWSGGKRGEPRLLAACYHQAMALAAGNGAQSVAFPAVSTGAYRYPRQAAARIAVTEVASWLADHAMPQRVTFCCFSEPDADVYRAVFVQLGVDH